MGRTSRAAWEAAKALVEESIFSLLKSMLKTDGTEEAYAEFGPAARLKTDAELHLIAKYAAEFYIKQTRAANKVPREKVRKITKEAIAHALERLDDENNQ